MKQYNEIKAKYPDALLLFRVGDFYETFGEDAVRAAGILGIVLTRRANGAAQYIELAGFPHHSLDTYLPKLVRAGLRVAICDQLEDPKATKTIVKRGVTELVTPGLATSDKLLDYRSNTFLAAVVPGKEEVGLAFLDHSTGEFMIAQGKPAYAEKLIQNFQPGEVLMPKTAAKGFKEIHGERFFSYPLDEWIFQETYSRELLQKQFDTISLKGFGVEGMPLAIIAAGACLHYLNETNHDKTAHITAVSRIEEDKFMWLDGFTIRNLELFSSAYEQAMTLFDVINHTLTPMGARMLKRWLALPLKDLRPIQDRLQLVDLLRHTPELAVQLSESLKQIGDLERIIAKVAVQRVNPRELKQLQRALYAIAEVQQYCAASVDPLLQRIGEQLNPCLLIRQRIENEISDEAPVALHKGDVISDGVDAELDELRDIKRSGKDYLLKIQQREIEATGITSLKISFNNVFGYYLEVTNSHKDKVPETWIRKQTLVNAERYITPEIKVFEEKILGAEDRIAGIESRLYQALLSAIAEYIQPIQHNAFLLAQIDCLRGFADLAERNNYCRPEVNDGFALEITDGRHPVIEKQLGIGVEYVANDVLLDPDGVQLMMITGPNMSGKSALLRQTALITIMAQIGCFVPASAAKIGLVDKIFTRVGASDNISSGESTFMVEMNETASILNNLSDRSLILLDEIGRGTSTYDGISIAWAIAEFLHEQPVNRAKTLFATHYHELNDMAARFPRIRNFNVSVKEVNQKVIFLRKLKEGGSNHSFGIHVAKMAGMPRKLVDRATEILHELEKLHRKGEANVSPKVPDSVQTGMQLSFFQLNDPVLENIKEELEKTDINNLTPMDALLKLNEIKRLLGG
ncbi:MAG TPA: DNA mismatch repair protein MutS [Flavobacteriales bacterium]|nr:DNA mismatch repair protein MutS [Flavobacteriales bacterium]